MAEKKEEAKEEGKEEAKGGGKTKLFIAIGVVVVLAGVGAFFALSGSKEKKDAEEEAVEAEAEGAEGAEGAGLANKPAILPLDPFIVNLQVKGSFLKSSIQLEFAEPTIPPSVEHDLPIIRDAIIQILSSKAAGDLLTVEGKAKLREELRDGINEALGAEDIVEVYFTEFIIQ